MNDRFVSRYCAGEHCAICSAAAEHKVEEVLFDDDPHAARHPLTVYLCHSHFRFLMGPAADWPRRG
jgi:hypothetical protein